MKALTVADVARELGKSAGWLYDHWQDLVAKKRIPPPIIESGGMTWSAAQLYAFLDKPLTREQRAHAAAFRAAMEAASKDRDLDTEDEVAKSRIRLDQRFGA